MFLKILYFIIINILFTFSVSFNKTTFVLFLYDKGLTNFEANLLFSVFNISVILFEPLSAIISELLPKKGSFIIGCILKVITSLIFINAQSLKVLIIAEIISGLSIGFISGSLVAWAVDKLKSKNQWENGYEIFA